MKILAVKEPNLNTLAEYFDFNQIAYDSVDIWDPALDTFGRHIINQNLIESSDTLLIVGSTIFYKMCLWQPSCKNLIEFCNNGNVIWIYDEIDSLVNTLRYQSMLLNLSSQIRQGSIKIFLDGILSDKQPLNKIKNITFSVLPYSFFFQAPRIFKANSDKISCSKDFLLTMIKKIDRPHREILFDQLQRVPGLLTRGHVNYHVQGKRIGDQPHQHKWGDGHPSMDLYLDSWLEIVPETLYRDGFFITEKTTKPIVTKTPFLVVSTCRYLEYLQRFGFKTFGNLIDERYDQEHRIEDRVKAMLVQLQDIIANGTESFYRECLPILKHNQSRLFEIVGRKQFETDIFIAKHLEEFGIK